MKCRFSHQPQNAEIIQKARTIQKEMNSAAVDLQIADAICGPQVRCVGLVGNIANFAEYRSVGKDRI